jgi:hypothetical protein
MSNEPASTSWWWPSWRHVAGSTVVLFVVILAFLVGRVRAGADPGLVRETSAARQQQSAPPASGSGVDPQGADPQGVDPQGVDPFSPPQGGQGFDPGTGASGSTDNFGNAIPDDQGGGGFDPPSTHVS